MDKLSSENELLGIILDFIGKIIWPITTLTIVLIYRKSIQKLIHRTKKLELPGGLSIETIQEEIEQAKELATDIKTERSIEIQHVINSNKSKVPNNINKRMINLGLDPSPSGLDLSYYNEMSESDPRLALTSLRFDFELMIRNLAKGFQLNINRRKPISFVLSQLLVAGYITKKQHEFISMIFKICNSAVHGTQISKAQVLEVIEIGKVLVDDYLAWLDWGFRK